MVLKMIKINIIYKNKKITTKINDTYQINLLKNLFSSKILCKFNLWSIQYEIYEWKNNQLKNLRDIEKNINEYYENLNELNFHIVKHSEDILQELILSCDDDICLMCCSTFPINSGVTFICSPCKMVVYENFPDYEFSKEEAIKILSF